MLVPGILTFPQNTSTGYIQGTYPAFAVQSGDRFKATLSCEYGASDCFVIYRLDYRVGGGPVQTLGTFGERYDGLYYAADIDLSSSGGSECQLHPDRARQRQRPWRPRHVGGASHRSFGIRGWQLH